jgi:hypothetical protein
MLKNRFAVAALVLVLSVAFVPTPSHAAPWGWTSVSTVSAASAAGFLQKIGLWWNALLNGPERPAHRQGSIDVRKNGCGIDPNGTPCGTGAGAGGTGTVTASDPNDPSGSL